MNYKFLEDFKMYIFLVYIGNVYGKMHQMFKRNKYKTDQRVGIQILSRIEVQM